MTKDTLIILAGDFMDGLNGPYYCPECAILEGLLAYFPATRKRLDVRRIDFPRPRPEMVELLGEDNQECPCLILADRAKADGLPVQAYGDHCFINDHKAIIEYLARNHGVSRPSHD